MSMQDFDHAFDIIDSLLDGEQNQRKLHDLSQLHQILKCTKDRVDQSITFDSFAGAIDNEDCSGYLQELEDCLNEVHNQISDELERTDSTAAKETTQTSISDLDSYLHIDDPNKLCKLSDDEGIGLPDNNQIRVDERGTGTLIRGLTYQPTLEEQGIIKQTRNQYNVQLTEQDRTETYISSLEKELLVCKTRERELVIDRADLVENIRKIHGILEDKQKQLNNYVGECEEKLTTSHNRYEAAIAERDAALAERDKMLAEHEPLIAERDMLLRERDSIIVERDNMESDKWDIMKQLREVEDRCESLQQEVKFRDSAIKSLQDEHERFSQECMCNSLDSLRSRTMSRSSSLRSKSSVGSKGSGLSRILTLRRHHDSDTDSFGSEEAAAANPKKKNRPRIQFGLFAEDSEREKRKLLDSLSEVPMVRWKSEAVVAWLELVVQMPMYSKACSENVKSGKVLLSLSDNDIQTGFGMINPLHKRKLRLALEDVRQPDSVTYPCLAKLDHFWVVNEWLPSIGLNQYKGTFRENLVDGRVLNSLTRKDIERHLNIVDRSHQTSISLGIELLAKYSYDLEKLAVKRAACQNIDRDVEVWTTGRCAEWLISIDLKEHANKLSYSGIHGAVITQDKDFNVDVLAAALLIPVQRKVLRRHMEQEIAVLKSGGSRRQTTLTKPKTGKFKESLSRAFNTRSETPDHSLKAFKAPEPGSHCKTEPDRISIKFDPEIYA
ncbi:hypothetical protein ACHWQZ_G011245 [Mnemiopsis leidyi]